MTSPKVKRLARKLLKVLDTHTLTLTHDERDLLIESLEAERDNAFDNYRDSDGADARVFEGRYRMCVDLLARLGVVTLEDDIANYVEEAR